MPIPHSPVGFSEHSNKAHGVLTQIHIQPTSVIADPKGSPKIPL
jgi:hypothetical protein